MKKGLSLKQKIFFTAIIGISFIFIVYLVLRFTLMEKNDELRESNEELSQQYQTLMMYVENKEKYEKETKDNIEETDKILNCYIGGMSKPWILHNFDENKKVYKLESSSLTLNENEEYATIDNDGRNLKMQTTKIDISYNVPYKNFFKFISDIRELDDNMTLESISISEDTEKDNLTGTISLTRYTVEGNSNKFEEPDIQVKRGVDRIFGYVKR